MNFGNQIIQYLLPALIGASVSWYAASKNNSVQTEELYADHLPEIWQRLDNITQERDDLKAQVESLQLQVKEQSKIIYQLNQSVNRLKDSINNQTKEIDKNVN
ncbi:hypothetical protein HC026_11170 [Lactobacillus sp. LC28-10]|uniref:Uncharacterized protein n=1 Tax=Secundilactobacillus angelensis TaxID=2722706 RepID=A0ABX1KZV8_9LACO|nr:hypothetical protein [Secundilactobacillus angelensis]MCH5463188.1 MRP8 family protein [Secundilactobacillus angelensis]NLR19453.1 hypothetical protein [Secundilactobacillus angelensis]